MARGLASIILVLIFAQILTALVFNGTILDDHDNKLSGIKTRRKDKSTSSDSDSDAKDGGVSESLEVVNTNGESSSSDGEVKKKTKKKKSRNPTSSVERKGWRKWHRKCTKCPEDMQTKWRDPSIKWICGAYQRARRTFKSLCMMYYRNCQDGTMFTKISDHRCPNGTKDGIRPYNHHFFYDYKVELTDESAESGSKTPGEADKGSTSVDDSELEKNLPPFKFSRR